jgi:hypothetical protein
MATLTINTAHDLPPSLFLFWSKEATTYALKKAGFDLNLPMKITEIDRHTTIYLQGESNGESNQESS